MEETKLLEELFDRKLIGVLRTFFQQSGKQLYLKEIAEKAGVSMATTHRILAQLVRLEILKEIKISKFKVYQLAENEKTEFLGSFIKQSVKVLELFVEQVKKVPHIETIVLHGKDTENRANVLIIGENVDTNAVKLIVAELFEKYHFVISYLTLARDQYQQMSDMGLYSGKKKVLYGQE
ncbi:helix-turn-helix domain-containing protein [Candidatus Woesearchaeota archaeon]|nr:helix-turn-helix domain-containing protein [Candidatus Woesearchaeota archaeon]